MLVYFDTNVYSLIAETSEEGAVRSWLAASGVTVLASASNLTETWATPRFSTRQRQLRALTTVAAVYEQLPQPYLHARELIGEVKRLRPQWVARVPRTKAVSRYIRNHSQLWDVARRGESPGGSTHEEYQYLSGSGAQRALLAQRAARASRGQDEVWLGVQGDTGLERTVELDPFESEQAWRVACLTSWHAAIVEERPESRDYLDFAGPYLKADAFRDKKDGATFWLTEVLGDRMRLNRVVGLAQHFQVSRKLQASNAGDTLHAGYMAGSDVLVTADRRFAAVLAEIAGVTEGLARVCYIGREQGALTALKRALEESVSTQAPNNRVSWP